MTPLKSVYSPMDQHISLLQALRDASGPVRKTDLSSGLGWDHEQITRLSLELCQRGYPIQSDDDGLRLTSSVDLLLPFEFKGRSDRMHCFFEVDSTMTEARELARSGCPPFSVVVAEQQVSGRGRLKRSWYSTTGGLYFTVVLRPDLSLEDSGQVNFLASVILVKILEDHYGIMAGVKWPNDILVNNRKIAGMLSELEADGQRLLHLNIGIGLNVNNAIPSETPNAVSLKELLGKPIDRAPILTTFLDELEAKMRNMSWETTLSAWRKRSVTLNRSVKIITTQELVEGLAIDIDNKGALILQTADGNLRKVIYGDCFIQPDPGMHP